MQPSVAEEEHLVAALLRELPEEGRRVDHEEFIDPPDGRLHSS
jgi:hypothetical protein